MPRYADPTRCPDCSALLPVAPRVCPSCGLPLEGPLINSLFATLQRADGLLVDLRRTVSAPVPSTRPAPSARPVQGAGAPIPPAASRMARPPVRNVPPVDPAPWPAPAAPGPAPAPGPVGNVRPPGWPGAAMPPPAPAPAPAPAPTPPGEATGLGLGLVPKILLGLGGLCLLVGAITFLAMAWDTLGVGGRTLTLVAFTLAAGAGAAELGRRRLRIGAESLTVVALGLLSLDIVGAGVAGWFGDLSDATITALAGGVTAAASSVVLAATSVGQRRPLIAGQVVAFVSLHVAGVGLQFAVESGWAWTLGAATASFILLGMLGRLRAIPGAVWAGVLGACTWWLALFVYAIGRVLVSDSLDLATLVGEGHAGPLLLAAAMLPLLALPAKPTASVMGAATGASALLVTWTLLLPAGDERDLIRVVAVSGAVLAWTSAVAMARGQFATWATRVAALGLWPLAAVLTAVAIGRAWIGLWSDPDLFSSSAMALTQPPAGFDSPLLTLLLTVAVGALPALVARSAFGWTVRDTLLRTGPLLSLGIVVTVAQYEVPLLVVLLVGLLLQAAWTGVGLLRGHAWMAALTAPVAFASLVAAVPSDVSATVLFTTWAVLAGLTARFGRGGAATWAFLALPVHAALAVWSLAAVVDAPTGAVPLVVLLVVAPLPLVKPELDREVVAMGVFGVSALGSLTVVDNPMSWLAAHLVGLAIVCAASALLHETRRSLAWVGGVCLALAAWLRMADLGVDTVEAYTLPAALVLLVLGGELMRRNPGISSVAGLLVGLLLATLPSLVIVLGTSGSMGWRGGLLATACLAMVVSGVWLRLSTPLVVGATIGVILAMWVLGPVASDLPTFIWLGTAGVLLTVMGITWEARLANLRATGAYLARLR